MTLGHPSPTRCQCVCVLSCESSINRPYQNFHFPHLPAIFGPKEPSRTRQATASNNARRHSGDLRPLLRTWFGVVIRVRAEEGVAERARDWPLPPVPPDTTTGMAAVAATALVSMFLTSRPPKARRTRLLGGRYLEAEAETTQMTIAAPPIALSCPHSTGPAASRQLTKFM